MAANPRRPNSSSRTGPGGLLRRKHGSDGSDGSDDGDKSTQGSSSGSGSNNGSPTSSQSTPPATVTHTQVQTQTQTQVQTQPPATTTIVNAPPAGTTGTPSGGTSPNNINNINDASDPSNPLSPSSTLSIGSSTGSSVPSSSSSSAASFAFKNPQNATACNSLTFSWTYTGSSQAAMTLEVEPVQNTANITRILTTDASASSKSYIWPVVNVDQGWYIAKGFDTSHSLGLSAMSSPFWVTDGSNVACLSATSTSGGSGPPSPTGHSPHGQTDGKLGPDQIVAVVLGAAAAVLLFVGGFIGYKVWKQRRDNPKLAGPTKGPRLPSVLY